VSRRRPDSLSHEASREASFVSDDLHAAIPVDLLTPLGAYLRLRGEGGGSFLLESVERGRLGRNSFMGRGARIVSLEEAEDAELPVVGYVSYDYARQLEPTVPLPDDGTGLPESSFVVADTLVRFDHGAGVADVLAGDPEEVGRALSRRSPDVGAAVASKGSSAARRRRSATRRWCDLPGAHPRRRRVPGRPSQRAERPTSASPLALYRALRRVNPSPYLFLLELGGVALVGSSPSGSSRASTAARASARLPGRRRRTTATPSGCCPRRRTAPSTSCSSTSAATTFRACAAGVACGSPASWTSNGSRTCRTSSPR
jgi:anthranilate synthase component 1